MELSRIKTAQLDEIVFDGRNKEYGAYMLRQLYNKNVRNSFIIACIFFLVALGGPVILKYINPAEEIAKKKVEIVDMADLKPPPPVDQATPPPPPPPPPPPIQSTIKFVPPVIKPDEEVPAEDPPKQEEMKEVQVASETKKVIQMG